MRESIRIQDEVTILHTSPLPIEILLSEDHIEEERKIIKGGRVRLLATITNPDTNQLEEYMPSLLGRLILNVVMRTDFASNEFVVHYIDTLTRKMIDRIHDRHPELMG